MRLYYFRDPKGNFGDDLNPWLWRKMYPEVIEGTDDELFVGIGTLLNHRLPKGVQKHVFGAGFGYGDPPDLRDNFVFHAVRGPRTAHVLGVAESLAVTDAAVLIRAVSLPGSTVARAKVGFMPHAASNDYYDWGRVCEELEFTYINARDSVDKVLSQIRSCDVVVCEAMHGAIVADALRVPWVPVACYDYISEFKWRDWLDSLRMEYQPFRVTSLYDVQRSWGLAKKLKRAVKGGMYRAGMTSREHWKPPPVNTGFREYRSALVDLRAAARSRPYLSDDSLVISLTERYVNILGELRRLNE